MATKVKIDTSKGVMIAELYDVETPNTVENFKKLIGEKFYDGLNFHRVIPGFVVQGGCPNKNGSGGPGYTIPCETRTKKQFHDKGVLSMAHAGRHWRFTILYMFEQTFYSTFRWNTYLLW